MRGYDSVFDYLLAEWQEVDRWPSGPLKIPQTRGQIQRPKNDLADWKLDLDSAPNLVLALMIWLGRNHNGTTRWEEYSRKSPATKPNAGLTRPTKAEFRWLSRPSLCLDLDRAHERHTLIHEIPDTLVDSSSRTATKSYLMSTYVEAPSLTKAPHSDYLEQRLTTLVNLCPKFDRYLLPQLRHPHRAAFQRRSTWSKKVVRSRR